MCRTGLFQGELVTSYWLREEGLGMHFWDLEGSLSDFIRTATQAQRNGRRARVQSVLYPTQHANARS